MDSTLLKDVTSYLQTSLHFNLLSYSQISKGMSNKLFCLLGEDGRKLLLKQYYNDATDKRFEKEYKGIALLRANGITHVPQAFYKNEELYYAVYSFEEGLSKDVQNLTRTDIEQMVSFLVSIYHIEPNNVDPVFTIKHVDQSFEYYLKRLEVKLKLFKNFEQDDKHISISQFMREDQPVEFIEQSINNFRKKLSDKDLLSIISNSDIRYSPNDFGPHNIIFQEDGNLVFIDFEYFSLRDFLYLPAEFMNHDQTYAIKKELKDYFLRLYKDQIHLNEEQERRFLLLCDLTYTHWLIIFFGSLLPEGVNQIKFADPNFNEEKYIGRQISKFKERVENYHFE